jgi:hypothetical protein
VLLAKVGLATAGKAKARALNGALVPVAQPSLESGVGGRGRVNSTASIPDGLDPKCRKIIDISN